MTRAQMTRLERLQALYAPVRGGVVFALDGETIAQAVERAVRTGRIGPFIVMPPAQDADEWERETVAQQAALLRRAEVYLKTGRDPLADG
jgi:hypothetical protein